ncbi:MAG: hypothetical protein JSU73_14090, partial [candidate division WOR-3 bacterium]
MAEMDDTDWGTLLRKIKDGECTPFLGAGACFPVGMLGGDIAEWLSRSYHYPWKETRRDLARVAQYVAAKHKDRQIVVGAVRERFFGKAYPWYKRRD